MLELRDPLKTSNSQDRRDVQKPTYDLYLMENGNRNVFAHSRNARRWLKISFLPSNLFSIIITNSCVGVCSSSGILLSPSRTLIDPIGTNLS
jgi:hypothetical protein